MAHRSCASCYKAFKCNHCGNNFSKKSVLVRHTLVVFGAKEMAKVMAKVMAHTFKTSLSLMRHTENSVCTLSPGSVGAEGGVIGEFIVLLDRSGVSD